MRSLFGLFLVSLFGLSGCALGPHYQYSIDDPTTKVKLEVFRMGNRPPEIDESVKTEPLYVKEMTSPEFTDRVVELLKNAGYAAVSVYKLTEPMPPKRNEMNLRGEFMSFGHIKSDLKIAQLFETKNAQITTSKSIGNFLTIGVYLALDSLIPFKAPNAIHAAEQANLIANVSGVAGSLNEMAYDDYRGRCTTDCDDRFISKQWGGMGATFIQRDGDSEAITHSHVFAKLSTDHIIAYELIDRATIEALRPLLDNASFVGEYHKSLGK